MAEQRLIDANALIKALIRKETFSDCARVVIAECIEEVRHAPTIEERKKGKWIDGLKCSHCGQVDTTKPNFCPSCGSYNGGGNEI